MPSEVKQGMVAALGERVVPTYTCEGGHCLMLSVPAAGCCGCDSRYCDEWSLKALLDCDRNVHMYEAGLFSKMRQLIGYRTILEQDL